MKIIYLLITGGGQNFRLYLMLYEQRRMADNFMENLP